MKTIKIPSQQTLLNMLASLESFGDLGRPIAVIREKPDERLLIASEVRDYSEQIKEGEWPEKEVCLLLINGTRLYLPNASLEDPANYCTFNNRTYQGISVKLSLLNQ